VTFDNPEKAAVWQTILDLNDCWREGHPEDLANYFHRDMIAITPGARERIEGGIACAASWTAFARGVKTHWFRESDPWIEVRGDMAVVAYYYDMEFERAGESVRASGRDLFVLVRENGRWLAIADHFSPDPRAGA